MTSAYVATFIVSLLGNAIGMYVVCRKSRNTANLLIANMAAADLLLTISIMPYSVTNLYIGSVWFAGVFGYITCTAVFYAFVVSIAASILTILVLSIDRFYSVLHPLQRRHFLRPKAMSAVIWILSLLLMSPNLLVYRTLEGPDGRFYCMQMWYWEEDTVSFTKTYQILKVFHILYFVVLYAVPLSIIAVLHVLIGRRLWLRKIPGNATDRNKVIQERSKRKGIKLLSVIVVVFALCWIPTYVMHYYIYLAPEMISREAMFISFWVSHAQSSINPCLYILLNDKFRKDFLHTLKLRPLSRSDWVSMTASGQSGRSTRSNFSQRRSTDQGFPMRIRSGTRSSVVSGTLLKAEGTWKDTEQ